MKCKHLRLIMELIFIFILPLLFILPNVSIENTFVYDNVGNYQTSERSISYTPIVYTTKTDTTYDLIHTSEWLFNDYTGDIYFSISDSFTYYAPSAGYYAMYYESGREGLRSVRLLDNAIVFYSDNENDATNGEFVFSYITIGNYYVISVQNFTYDVVQEFDLNNGYYIITANTSYKNSPIVDLKNILADVILIDSINATYNVVFDYTCLWLIMFIVWHFVYRLFDWIVHLIDKKGD